MRIYRTLDEVSPRAFGPAVLTIGNFDGVHRGHQKILHRVREIAAAKGWKPSVLTFDPHPTRVVAPERSPLLIASLERRMWLMEHEGIEQVLILPFTEALAQTEPEEFIEHLLRERLDARVVLVGENFRFGRGQRGDGSMLRRLGAACGIAVEVVPQAGYRNFAISSSAIRRLVTEGRVDRAGRFLGRPFAVEGVVVRGRGVGSKETVPTLNLETDAELLPLTGVYLTRTTDLDGARTWNSITNIGYRPTFGASDVCTIETFLLGTLEGETPRRIRVEWLMRVRGERSYPTSAELKARILRDVQLARGYFRRREAWTE